MKFPTQIKRWNVLGEERASVLEAGLQVRGRGFTLREQGILARAGFLAGAVGLRAGCRAGSRESRNEQVCATIRGS